MHVIGDSSNLVGWALDCQSKAFEYELYHSATESKLQCKIIQYLIFAGFFNSLSDDTDLLP